MAIIINQEQASVFLREQARTASLDNSNAEWMRHIIHMSELCAAGAPVTHIAFLGAALLAKSMNPSVDVSAFKPKHPLNKDNPNSVSLRPLAHGVLVPASAEFGFSIGATGREPLNNQPYFRMGRLGDNTPVHANGQEIYRYTIDLVTMLSDYDSDQSAAALRAFITVRKNYQANYVDEYEYGVAMQPSALLKVIQVFVANNSEGGKSAQAITAGILDVYSSPDLVMTGRINDPSKNRPGDVCLFSDGSMSYLEKAFEVKDKPMSLSDIYIFGRDCVSKGAKEAAVVMSHEGQEKVDIATLNAWAEKRGITITLFLGWEELLKQSLFWSRSPTSELVNQAVKRIRARLNAIQISKEGLSLWDKMINNQGL